MQPKPQKTVTIKAYTKGDYEEAGRSKKNRKGTPQIGVDFSKIEQAASTKFEREVQGKIAVGPDACDRAMQLEERALLYAAIENAGLSPREYTCLKQYLDGEEQKQTARMLTVLPSTVASYLDRAKKKVRAYLLRRS